MFDVLRFLRYNNNVTLRLNVFSRPQLQPLETLRNRVKVKKYADAARLVDVSPHDSRHRFGYRMAEAVPLHRLAQIMGHDSLNTTRIYVQGTKQDLQHAVETIAWT